MKVDGAGRKEQGVIWGILARKGDLFFLLNH